MPIFDTAPSLSSPALSIPSLARKPLLGLWSAPSLNRILNASLSYAPEPVRRWLEEERQAVRRARLEERIRTRPRLVPESDLYHLVVRGLRTLARRHGQSSIGDYLEFGVYNGTSLTCIFRALNDERLRHVRLFGFDSFQGFPAHAAHEDDGRWQPGKCCSSLEFTRAVLNAEGIDWERVALVPGWFSDTLNQATRHQHRITKASVIMIDCDLYSSTKEALCFCEPLIEDEAVVLFDEYYPRNLEDRDLGEKKALREFLEESGCFAAVPFGAYAPRTQAFLLSRKA